MRKKTIYTLLTIIIIIGFWLFENFYTPSTYSAPKVEEFIGEIPAEFFPSSTTGDIIEHSYFTLSYSERHEQAEWVAYELNKNQLTYDDRQRPYFIEDPKVKTKSADWKNYKGSGYDRGHLCPAGDRRFTEDAYNETFYTSNISPQNQEFNAGIWNELEQKVRYWCKRYGSITVITGGVLEENLTTIGEEDVSVPKYYYKVVARKNGNDLEAIGFLFENRQSNESLQSHVVSIDEIERKTGINFFEKLPDKIENRLEGKKTSNGWKF